MFQWLARWLSQCSAVWKMVVEEVSPADMFLLFQYRYLGRTFREFLVVWLLARNGDGTLNCHAVMTSTKRSVQRRIQNAECNLLTEILVYRFMNEGQFIFVGLGPRATPKPPCRAQNSNSSGTGQCSCIYLKENKNKQRVL